MTFTQRFQTVVCQGDSISCEVAGFEIIARIVRHDCLYALDHYEGHDEGAKARACIASLIETCKLNDVEPFGYLRTTLKAIAQGHPMKNASMCCCQGRSSQSQCNELVGRLLRPPFEYTFYILVDNNFPEIGRARATANGTASKTPSAIPRASAASPPATTSSQGASSPPSP